MKYKDSLPVAFRLELKPGDYLYYKAEDLFKEKYWKGARIHGLFDSPQPDCSDAVAVYKGRFWVEYHRATPDLIAGAMRLYLGPTIYEPGLSEEVLMLFPSMRRR